MQYWGTGRLGAHQNVAFTSTAGTIANGFASGTNRIRVLVTSDAYIKIDSSPTATTSDVYLPGLSAEYFTVTAGQKVSAIQVSSAGTLHVTEVS